MPNVSLHLGDVGILRRDRFVPVGSLSDLGIAFESIPSGPAIPYVYHSRSGVHVEFLTGAGLPVAAPMLNASGSVKFTFGSKGGVVFIARNGTSTRIRDQIGLRAEIERRYEAGNWDRTHGVITELVSVERATILVAESSDAAFELQATADVPTDLIEIADVDAKFGVRRTHGIGFQSVGEAGLTPLFKASGIKRRFFGSSVFTVRGSGGNQVAETVFQELDYNDIDALAESGTPD